MLRRNVPLHALVLTTVVGFIQASESAVEIGVDPAEIDKYGRTLDLEVRCSVTVTDSSNMAALCSMIISRSNDSGQSFTDLASITEFSPNTVNLATSESVFTAGMVYRAGESYLHLKWENPTAHQAGVYKCSAQGVDSFGHIVISSDTTQVTVLDPNFDIMLTRIQDHTSYLEETVLQMSNELKAFEEIVRRMDNYTQDLETKLSEIEAYTKGLEDKISKLDTALSAETARQSRLLSYLFEANSLSYNNHTYYVSKNGFTDVDFCMLTCSLCDGYLVEINDAEELHVLQDFLRKSTGFTQVSIAGSDRVTEGNFILPSTGMTIPYAEWGPGNPAPGSNAEDCLGLYSGYQWKMYDASCKFDPPEQNRRYMCEVPQN